jgi:uncharacterized protein
VGQPAVELEFAVDKPVASVAIRLNDVWPTGEVSRITYHLQNLCMRESRESPQLLVPGHRYKMKIKLDDIAWRVPKGHKIRVSISTTYFPMMWPAPEPVTLTVYAGKSLLHLPLRKDQAGEAPVAWKDAEAAEPAKLKELKAPWNKREKTVDEKTGELKIEIVDDFGEYEIKPHGMVIYAAGRESYSIMPNDPLSARMDTHWTEERRRGNVAHAHGNLWPADGDQDALDRVGQDRSFRGQEEGLREGVQRADRAEDAVGRSRCEPE